MSSGQPEIFCHANIRFIFSTLPVFHLPMGWSNNCACANILLIVFTLRVSKPLISSLKYVLINKPYISVTKDVFQLEI